MYAPFSLEFYLNYKISIEIQGLSRCMQTKWKDFTAVAIAGAFWLQFTHLKFSTLK